MSFVNWRAVNALFCGLMWVLVLALAVVILVHRLPDASGPHHVAASALR